MKKIVAILIIALMLLPFLFSEKKIAQASNIQKENSDIPEKDGVYDVPGHSNLKVRVFVHNPKPTPTDQPSLVCNLSDPDSNAVVAPTGWHLPSGNWTYKLNIGSTPSSIGSNLVNIADSAFATWSSSSVGAKVAFVNGGTTGISRKGFDRNNIIAWGRTSGSALAVTYTWYYPSTGLVAEVDTIMNKKYQWSWTAYSADACVNSNTYDAQDILTHELGHWIGLNDEYTSSYVNSTMYGYGSKGEIKKDTLTTGDSAGVSAIY
ncbi:MAG: hypothetical protein A2857_00650 [Candidatus Levybacteria bacterium RIFCSPHIGHO2_01_FULL_36_15]|nr:MAG: hypothetical protein A2857_00650 [Candidatus Levybacteria bacterium RIFCSPHIGHO2_01_FULL_36_15]